MSPGEPAGEVRGAEHPAQYSILQYAGPGQVVVNVGVLLVDPVRDTLYLRLRSDWQAVAQPGDDEVLALLEAELGWEAERIGAFALLASLEDNLSNTVRVTDRQPVQVADFDEALAALYGRHVP